MVGLDRRAQFLTSAQPHASERLLDSLSGRRGTDCCELSPREEGWVDPRVLSGLYFVKNDLKHSGRTGIISIALRGLALAPKDQTIMK